MRRHRDIVVVGASSGGLDAVSSVLAQLPADFPAAVFVAIHAADSSRDFARLLGRASALPVRGATDRGVIYHGNVYVAPADAHLLIESEHMRLSHGPKENRCRPSIDVLFRSAAVAYGPRTIGLLMTGYLDDGVAGLEAIERRGGLVVVQHPGDAVVPDMPRAALDAVNVHHCAPVHRLGALLGRAVAEPILSFDAERLPDGLAVETAIAAERKVTMKQQEALGHLEPYGCPECGGPLSRIEETQVRRYRCHIGHAYTAKALLRDQGDQVERALSAALRTLGERASVLEDIARDMGEDPHSLQSTSLRQRAEESRRHAEVLRQLLLSGLESDSAAA